MAGRFTLLVALLLAAFGLVPRAHAQDVAASPATAEAAPSASQIALARRLFVEGVEAAEARRFDEARAAFERSYALSGREVTLLNLAHVLAESGKLVAAVDTYRRFFARADAETQARHGEDARAALVALELRLASLTIVVRNVRADDVVQLDEGTIAQEGLGLEVPVDPGPHTVDVRRGSVSCARRTVRLAERERGDVELDASCPPPPEEVARLAAVEAEAQAVREREAVRVASERSTRAWTWVGIGAGVLAAAGVAVAVVFLAQPDPIPPYVGNFGPGTITLP
jgi:hypothetical protein